MTLTGIPTVDVDVAVLEADGDELDIEIRPSAGDALRTVTAVVEPGADYLVRVTEPPTSMVFAFDTSFSIGPYSAAVYQGWSASRGSPGTGDRQHLAVRRPMLLDESGDESFLPGHDRELPADQTSSDAEGALVARRRRSRNRGPGDDPDHRCPDRSDAGRSRQTLAGLVDGRHASSGSPSAAAPRSPRT